MTASYLPILNYHGIESRDREYDFSAAEQPYVVLLSSLKEQFSLLLQNGFQSLSLRELNDWLEGYNLKKQIVITFDDGHLSHYEHAVPMLRAYQMKAVFLISSALVGQKGLMNWSHLKDLVSEGFDIGSHGLTHEPLSDLSHHYLWKELSKSKSILEDKLGIKVTSFSVPRGYYQDRIREVALEIGYRFVFTSRFDVNVDGAADRFRLNRIAIKKGLRPERFLKLVHGQLGYKKTIEKMKETARHYIKPSFYDALAKFKRTVVEGYKELP